MHIKATTKRTFSLTQEDILAIVADYLNKSEGINIKPGDLTLRISDSYDGDYHGNYRPARIQEISVTISE